MLSLSRNGAFSKSIQFALELKPYSFLKLFALGQFFYTKSWICLDSWFVYRHGSLITLKSDNDRLIQANLELSVSAFRALCFLCKTQIHQRMCDGVIESRWKPLNVNSVCVWIIHESLCLCAVIAPEHIPFLQYMAIQILQISGISYLYCSVMLLIPL